MSQHWANSILAEVLIGSKIGVGSRGVNFVSIRSSRAARNSSFCPYNVSAANQLKGTSRLPKRLFCASFLLSLAVQKSIMRLLFIVCCLEMRDGERGEQTCSRLKNVGVERCERVGVTLAEFVKTKLRVKSETALHTASKEWADAFAASKFFFANISCERASGSDKSSLFTENFTLVRIYRTFRQTAVQFGIKRCKGPTPHECCILSAVCPDWCAAQNNVQYMSGGEVSCVDPQSKIYGHRLPSVLSRAPAPLFLNVLPSIYTEKILNGSHCSVGRFLVPSWS